MKSSRWRPAQLALAILAGIGTSACSTTWVVVPHPATQYTATDTVWGMRDGERVRVTFRHDTVMRVDTVVRVDTAWMRGSRTIVRVDTVRTQSTDTVVRTRTVLRVDTVHVASKPIMRVDTVLVTSKPVLRIDTVRVPVTQTIVRTDTVKVPVTQTIVRTDTLMRVDTLRVVVTDTVVRTVQIPGRRLLFVPPGHYPPDGQCRVWIHGTPPGQQAKPAACDALGDVPAGAFILFAGDAWDFDYDWIAEAGSNPGSVPPQIVALKRNKPNGPAIGSGRKLR